MTAPESLNGAIAVKDQKQTCHNKGRALEQTYHVKVLHVERLRRRLRLAQTSHCLTTSTEYRGETQNQYVLGNLREKQSLRNVR